MTHALAAIGLLPAAALSLWGLIGLSVMAREAVRLRRTPRDERTP
jgi:hypothetical protein